MSQLVECVPNFSEGNNQEVSAGAAGHRAWGEEEGVCLAWGWGGLFSGMNCLLWSAHREEPQERRGSERLSRGEEETVGCTFGQGSWPWGWVTGLLNPKLIGWALLFSPLSRRMLRPMELVQATEGHGAPAPNHGAVRPPQKVLGLLCPSPSAAATTGAHLGGQGADPL